MAALPMPSVTALIRAGDADKLRIAMVRMGFFLKKNILTVNMIYVWETNGQQDSRTLNMDERDGETGRNPLLIAAEAGRRDIVGVFLAKGADVRAVDDEQCNALHLAAR